MKYKVKKSKYKQMYEDQDGRCSICLEPVDFGKLVVDHDHSTGEVRSLLCDNCNLGLGMFKDNSKILRRAASYIDDHFISIETNLLLGNTNPYKYFKREDHLHGFGRPSVHQERVFEFMEQYYQEYGTVAPFSEVSSQLSLPQSTASRLRKAWIESKEH